jgi:hypothetical protein
MSRALVKSIPHPQAACKKVEFGEIIPQQRLPPGETDGHHPQLGGLAEDVLPGARIEFAGAAPLVPGGPVDAAVDAGVVAAFRQFDVKVSRGRTLPFPEGIMAHIFFKNIRAFCHALIPIRAESSKDFHDGIGNTTTLVELKAVCGNFLCHIFYQSQNLFPPVGGDQRLHHMLGKKPRCLNALCHRHEAVYVRLFQEKDGGKRGGAGGNVRQFAVAPGPVNA